MALGVVAGLAFALALALAVGLFSLRVQAIFFAMVTLAVAYAFNVLASQSHPSPAARTGARSSPPFVLTPGFKVGEIFGVVITGRTLAYYLVFVLAAHRVSRAAARRQFAVRPRAAGDPRKPVARRSVGLSRRSSTARSPPSSRRRARRSAGALNAVWLRYVGPDTALSFSIQIDVLVIVVIGGMGSMYGAILGAALVRGRRESIFRRASGGYRPSSPTSALPLPQILHPDRWLLWLGLMFILAVYFAPTGIYGRLRRAED